MKHHSALTEESNFDRIKRRRKRNKLLLDIASIIMIVGLMLILAVLKSKV